MTLRTAALAIVCLAWSAGFASAQAFARIEVGGGLVSTGSASGGDQRANETSANSGPFSLFSTSTVLGWATGVEGRIGVRLTDIIQLEGAGSYGAPTLTTSISNDFESASAANAAETIKELMLQASAVVALPPGRGRIRPFVGGGIGYLRQLHEGATLVDSGRTLQVAGGVRVLLRSGGRSHVDRLGLRGDVRLVARTKGVAPDGGTHAAPAFGASLYVGF